MNEAVNQLKEIFLEIEHDPVLLSQKSGLVKESIPPSIALADIQIAQYQQQYKQTHRRKYESFKLRLILCLQALNKCLFKLFPNFYQYPLVDDAIEAERLQEIIKKNIIASEAVSIEDVRLLFEALESAVNKLIHVGKSEVWLH